jgi:hypothetical protein
MNLTTGSVYVFLSNVGLACKYHYYVYAALFAALFATSLVVHTQIDDGFTNTVDKMVILFVALYGASVLARKCKNTLSVRQYVMVLLIVATFVATLWLYIYGFCTHQYCFDQETHVASMYHSLMHVIGSVGHHLIVLL